MRIPFLLFLIFLQFRAIGQAIIEISNASSLPRNDEIITVPWTAVLDAYPDIDTANFIVINSITKKQATYQIEYLGASQARNLLIQATVLAKSKLTLHVKKGKPAVFAAKTYSRYVPERKDDFAWENDRIAFRMYGKALEKTPSEMAYGVDVWVKRTGRLIINERYQRGEYHVDHGDGMDYYHVGLTLGAGGIAPYIHDTIWFSKNYTQWKVLDNGPLRSTFQLGYEEWPVALQQVSVIKTISLDAGSQLSKIEANYSFKGSSSLPLAAGIIKRKEPGTEWFDEKSGIMAYWEPVHGKDGTTGVACLFTQPVKQVLMDKEHLLTVVETRPNQPLIYYSGAAWDKAGVITSAEQWFSYLKAYKQKLEQPLNIIVHNTWQN